MGKLVPFSRPIKTQRKARALGPPPADALQRASWIHDMLCNELYAVRGDLRLTEDERRAQVLKLSQRIITAMPHHEIAAAREEIRAAERRQQATKLEGEVSPASGGKSVLRAAAPRGKK